MKISKELVYTLWSGAIIVTVFLALIALPAAGVGGEATDDTSSVTGLSQRRPIRP